MNLKKILPFESYTLESKLSVDKVKQRLINNVAPKKSLNSLFSRYNSRAKPYEGEVTEDTFTIKRVINYNNAFLPQITGNISSFLGVTTIDIKMKLSSLGFKAIAVWLIGLLIILFMMFFSGTFKFLETYETDMLFIKMIPVFMIVSFFLTMIIAFKIESRKSKKFLVELFEAKKNM